MAANLAFDLRERVESTSQALSKAYRKQVESQLQTCLEPSDDRTCVTYICDLFFAKKGWRRRNSRCMYCSRRVQFRCRNESGQVEETETLHMG